MREPIVTEAILTRQMTMADRGIRMVFDAPEGTDLGKVQKYLQSSGYLVFADRPGVEVEPPPAPKPENGEKSQSQRLYHAIFKRSEFEGVRMEDFRGFYHKVMDGLIEEQLRMAQPPLPEER